MEPQQTYFHFLSHTSQQLLPHGISEETHNIFVLSSDIVIEQRSVVDDRQPSFIGPTITAGVQ